MVPFSTYRKSISRRCHLVNALDDLPNATVALLVSPKVLSMRLLSLFRLYPTFLGFPWSGGDHLWSKFKWKTIKPMTENDENLGWHRRDEMASLVPGIGKNRENDHWRHKLSRMSGHFRLAV